MAVTRSWQTGAVCKPRPPFANGGRSWPSRSFLNGGRLSVTHPTSTRMAVAVRKLATIRFNRGAKRIQGILMQNSRRKSSTFDAGCNHLRTRPLHPPQHPSFPTSAASPQPLLLYELKTLRILIDTKAPTSFPTSVVVFEMLKSLLGLRGLCWGAMKSTVFSVY